VTRYDKRVQALAVGLSALAGYVDALGFIHLGGFFVSFMSGNSTRLGVGLIEHAYNAVVASILIGLFVVGVVIGSLAGRFAFRHRRVVVLVLVSIILATASVLNTLGIATAAVLLMVIAMGVENAVFERDGEVHIGLTYMTGTLVKLGQRIAETVTGGRRFAWASYLFLWLGLVFGAAAGTATYPYFGLDSLWIAAGFALMLAVAAALTNNAGQASPDPGVSIFRPSRPVDKQTR
jgi:uncharacterized membrane protein YoaK (UPF0700 family)